MSVSRSNQEQEMLELINELRLNPKAGVARFLTSYAPKSQDPEIQAALDFFQVDGALLRQGLTSLRATTPLLWNSDLSEAADGHTVRMIAADEQSHQLDGEPGLGDRVLATGYQFGSVGENIYAFGNSVLHTHAGFVIDWGFGPGGIQDPAGHRISIMNPDFDEVGLAIRSDGNPETDVGPMVTTQVFGTRRLDQPGLTGVVFTDRDRDGRYDAGEGRAGITVTVEGQRLERTTSTGGYSGFIQDGMQSLRFVGPSFGAITAEVEMTDTAKVDVVGRMLRSSTTLSITGGAEGATAIGIGPVGFTGRSAAETLTGNSAGNRLDGAGGNDRLFGGDGPDRLLGGSGNDRLQGQGGVDQLEAGPGSDILTGGSGADRFTISGGTSRDTDRILDFNPALANERILLPEADSFRDLTLRQQGDDVQITIRTDDGARTLILEDLNRSQINAGDFSF